MSEKVELWTADTPNSWKVVILFDELNIPYKLVPIDITNGDQFKPEFLKISPNNKIPAIIDHDVAGEPISVFESGAILLYFAQKTGKFLPNAATDPKGNAAVLQWLMWQMAGFGPMLGQWGYFATIAPEKIQYAIDRYTNEMRRLYKVLNTQLEHNTYVAGAEYSVADMAIWSWAALHQRQQIDLKNEFSHVGRWFFQLAKERPAIAALCKRLLERQAKEKAAGPRKFTPEQMKTLFDVDVNNTAKKSRLV